MRDKAFVSVLEMIFVVATLIIAFGIIFPGFSYQSRWEQAFISLKGRDLMLTIDRMGDKGGRLYQYSFDENALRDFLDKTVPTHLTNLIHWSGTGGALKPVVTVACDCDEDQKNALISWIGRIKVNGRDIDFDIVSSKLSPIFSQSDVLLIWGDKDLDPFKKNLEDYTKAGKGIVEIMDLTGSLDDAQKDIFGIKKCDSKISSTCGAGGAVENSFEPKPQGTTNKTYAAYKYFHHLPMPVLAPDGEVSFRMKPDLDPCISVDIKKGAFRVRNDDFNFWICDEITEVSAYFDAGGNPNEADIKVLPNQKFVIDGQEFLLSYIDAVSAKVGIAFLDYKFENFLNPSAKLYPTDEDENKAKFRILLSKGTYAQSDKPIPAAIVNGTVSRVAWVADFTEDLNKVGDDHKLLLASLLLWASEKKYVSGLSNLRLGHLTSYINVNNADVYEVYKFEIGLGFPF